MGEKSGIEWTDATWNPTRGCSRISPGCNNCYAETFAGRFCGEGMPYEGFAKNTRSGARWTRRVALVPEKLTLPLTWKKGRRIFVNSMSDLFHEKLSVDEIQQVFVVMALAPRHTFQVLTKRAERMAEVLADPSFRERVLAVAHSAPTATREVVEAVWPLRNVHLGVSVEDEQRLLGRLPFLVATEAAVRWLSCEPLLGPLGLRGRLLRSVPYPAPCRGSRLEREIDWVVVGGESGADSRPMHPFWVREIRDACRAAAVPFFFKQWGAWRPNLAAVAGEPAPIATAGRAWGTLNVEGNWFPKATPWNGRQLEDSYDAAECVVVRVGKKKAGALLYGTEHRAFPEVTS